MGQREPDSHSELRRLRARVDELERAIARHEGTEAQMRQLNARLSALLENTDDFILFSDRDGKPLFFNSAYAAVMKQLLGIDMQPGLKPHELLPDPQERAAWDALHRRALSGEKFKFEYAHELAEGNTRYFEVSYNPVRQDGEIIGFSEFTTDITQHKLAEQTLRDSNVRLEQLVAKRTAELQSTESRFRGITEHSADLISILNVESTFTYTAPSVRNYGYEPDDIVGAHASDFVHPDDYPRIAEAIRRAFEHPEKPVYVEVFRVRDADGTYLELEGQFTGLPSVPGIDGVVFNGREITERRRLEEHLRHAQKMDAIGQLAGGIAHDFNNQLTGILANADLLRLKLGDSDLTHYAQQIVQAAKRSADLTRQLLAFARRGNTCREPTDVNAMLADLVELLGRSFDKRIKLDVDLTDTPCVTVGDSTQIHNALLNLALNARDAMPDGGRLSIATTVVVTDSHTCANTGMELKPGAYVRITIADDGAGMDDQTLQRVFEPFFTTKAPGKGTGMGLATVYGTAQNHGGAVALTSAPGAGSTVQLYLPASVAVADARPSRTVARHASGARVVVVDDEEAVRVALADLLESLGHTVLTCADGLDAVELHRRSWQDIDLVILDMVMPRMSGSDTLAALRDIDPEVRVLVTSGATSDDEVQRLLDSGALGFLHKPFDAHTLSLAVISARKTRPRID